MESTPIFTYIFPSIPKEEIWKFQSKIIADLRVGFIELHTVSELISSLNDPKFYTDFILIDIDKLVNREDQVGFIDLIHSLTTMIKVSPQETDLNGLGKRNIKIIIAIRDTTDPSIVKQALKMPDVVLGTILTEKWKYNLVKEDFRRFLAGDFSPSKHILDLVKPKKSGVVKSKSITLTTREQQILSLIQDRGASNKVIAKLLDISESTVKLHVGKVLKKYGCRNRTQLALFSQRNCN